MQTSEATSSEPQRGGAPQVFGPFPNAYCLPGAQINRRMTGLGVFDAEGAVVPHTNIRTSMWRNRPKAGPRPSSKTPHLLGPALFAGTVDKQFGFILLNSLGRLPALAALPAATTLVYAAKPQKRQHEYGFVPRILQGFGVNNPVIVIEGPLRMTTLFTAPELFGECHGGRGDAAFYDWIDRQVAPSPPPDPEDRIYVTRRGLGPRAGRYACEDHLERLLAAEGYRIYAPEAHALEHQIATFRRAGRLIFAEGSALHLFALLRRPGQLSAVIHRRELLPPVMLSQMADRAGTPTLAVNAVQDIWWPPLRGEHLGVSVLDFDRLRTGLVAAGLITGQAWRAPDKAETDKSLRAGLQAAEMLISNTDRAAWLKNWRDSRRST